jgi:hypothetical protein
VAAATRVVYLEGRTSERVSAFSIDTPNRRCVSSARRERSNAPPAPRADLGPVVGRFGIGVATGGRRAAPARSLAGECGGAGSGRGRRRGRDASAHRLQQQRARCRQVLGRHGSCGVAAELRGQRDRRVRPGRDGAGDVVAVGSSQSRAWAPSSRC